MGSFRSVLQSRQGIRVQLLLRAKIEEITEFASMEATSIIVQSANGTIGV
jgi:hypothetical protein